MIGAKTEQRQAGSKTVALGLLLPLMAACLLLTASPAYAKTFFVNSTSDDGDDTIDGNCGASPFDPLIRCTLREALQEANATAAADTINFRIAGMNVGVKTISPATPLPTIRRPVTIDGYTQEGASANNLTQPGQTNASPRILLDGAGGAGLAAGLHISGSGASNSVIRGLAINHFLFGIALENGMGHRIGGNFIGPDPSGTAAGGNVIGVLLQNADGSTIGGTAPGARNLISGNSGHGVGLSAGASGNRVQGNLIGTDKNGNALGNGDYGVIVSSSTNSSSINNNTIGDSDPSDGSLTNAANTIAFNTDGGVQMHTVSTGNRILSNSIFSNNDPTTAGSELGIDLVGGTEDASGVTANDERDPDAGPNRLQNHPVLSFAQEISGNSTLIGGELNSTPSTRKKKRFFTIQLFSSPAADPSDHGEGQTFLGQIQVKTDRRGDASFGFEVGQDAVSEGEFVTATATNRATGDTSEFSEAERVEGPVIGGG